MRNTLCKMFYFYFFIIYLYYHFFLGYLPETEYLLYASHVQYSSLLCWHTQFRQTPKWHLEYLQANQYSFFDMIGAMIGHLYLASFIVYIFQLLYYFFVKAAMAYMSKPKHIDIIIKNSCLRAVENVFYLDGQSLLMHKGWVNHSLQGQGASSKYPHI